MECKLYKYTVCIVQDMWIVLNKAYSVYYTGYAVCIGYKEDYDIKSDFIYYNIFFYYIILD